MTPPPPKMISRRAYKAGRNSNVLFYINSCVFTLHLNASRRRPGYVMVDIRILRSRFPLIPRHGDLMNIYRNLLRTTALLTIIQMEGVSVWRNVAFGKKPTIF